MRRCPLRACITGGGRWPSTATGSGRCRDLWLADLGGQDDGDRLHFSYSEVARPPAVLIYDPARAVVEPGLGGLSESRVQVRWYRSQAIAADGTEVPITILSTHR
ncbi:MAG: hypothetical protein JO364_10800 [Pseudonocardiales bacterium]|nr:hypothetical protein [Pseudonocardiales bacterium]